MKVPSLAMPRLGLASFRRRILFRGAFLLLALATLALALALLTGEKERSYDTYRRNFGKTLAEVTAKLRHPAGQLALLNPALRDAAATPLRPLLLPFGAIDFDDPNKARQAVETAGCSVQYPDGSSLCVAVGNNPYAGGFIYLIGSFFSGPLVTRESGSTALEEWHRARVTLTMRGETTRWVAPFEAQAASAAPLGAGAASGSGSGSASSVRGRLTGFVDPGSTLPTATRPVRDFRGWLWQDAECAGGTTACVQRSFFSIRLPVEVFRDALFQKLRPVWPPPDLASTEVRFEMLAPQSTAPLFDSNAPGATVPLSLNDIAATLAPGETLRIRRAGANTPLLLTLKGAEEAREASAPWLDHLVRRLPVAGSAAVNAAGSAAVSLSGSTTPAPSSIESTETVRTAVGDYSVTLSGSLRSVDQAISVVATRMSWFVAAMLGAIAIAWALIELGLIRRIAVLTQRAAAISHNVQDAQADQRSGAVGLADLRGKDELGILAASLDDLLQRVKDDVQREQIRARQERDMWHAVGHEIMSPLQSLMVLHAAPDDASNRYVQRMQQAVRVLYGTASPSEALEAAALKVGALDLDAFLANIADNAHFAGISNVQFERSAPATPVLARADEFPLEDAVTHILTNAERFRTPGSAIVIRLTHDEATARIAIENSGPQIEAARLERIFEYGVSEPSGDATGDGVTTHRGQGLFVTKTYMAKMGGTVRAENTSDGVTFTLTLQRSA